MVDSVRLLSSDKSSNIFIPSIVTIVGFSSNLVQGTSMCIFWILENLSVKGIYNSSKSVLLSPIF